MYAVQHVLVDERWISCILQIKNMEEIHQKIITELKEKENNIIKNVLLKYGVQVDDHEELKKRCVIQYPHDHNGWTLFIDGVKRLECISVFNFDYKKATTTTRYHEF